MRRRLRRWRGRAEKPLHRVELEHLIERSACLLGQSEQPGVHRLREVFDGPGGNELLKARGIDRGDRGETRVLARQFGDGAFPSRPCDVDHAIRLTIAHAAPGGLVLQRSLETLRVGGLFDAGREERSFRVGSARSAEVLRDLSDVAETAIKARSRCPRSKRRAFRRSSPVMQQADASVLVGRRNQRDRVAPGEDADVILPVKRGSR